MSTLQACAPKKVIMHRFFHAPHRSAAMFGKTIERTEFSQGAQFVLCERHTALKIVQRFKGAISALPNEVFSVFLTQPINNTKSETHRVVINDCAMPIGLQCANRFDVYSVPLRILHNRG